MRALARPSGRLGLAQCRNGGDQLHVRNTVVLACNHNRAVRWRFHLAAGVRLRHGVGTALLTHVRAALVFQRGRRWLRHHASKQRSRRPRQGQEHKRDGDKTPHEPSVC